MTKSHIVKIAALIAVLLLQAAGLAAMKMEGIALDSTGLVQTYMHLIPVSPDGRQLTSQQLTNREGRFQFRLNGPVGWLYVIDRQHNVVNRIDGPWNDDVGLKIDLSQGKYHTYSGIITDSGNTMLQYLMDPGAKWSGEFDHIGSRMVSIQAYSGKTNVMTVNPAVDGKFQFQADFTIDRITVTVDAGGVYLEEHGPWQNGGEINFDFMNMGVFSITGQALDFNNKPLPREMIHAFDKNKNKLMYVYTDTAGRFELRSNVAIGFVGAQVKGAELAVAGPWQSNAAISLKMTSLPRNMIRGRVTDENGNPIPKVRVVPLDKDGRSKDMVDQGYTDSNGHYEATATTDISGVAAYRKNGQEVKLNGPFHDHNAVDLVFSSKDVYFIRGRVTDRKGDPVYHALVTTSDGNYHIKSTNTDRDGFYELEMVKPAAELIVYGGEETESKTMEGPFNQDTTVNVVLDE